ncbi:MAG: molybdopterin-binding protein [Candidatus Omnitrophota bacterium]
MISLRYWPSLTNIFLILAFAQSLVCAEKPPADQLTKYALVITGGELLKGIYADSHTFFITRALEPIGCQCVFSLSVGDVREDLLDALNYAGAHADLIITTGGLGPTDADVTRNALMEFTGIPLRENPEVVKEMQRRFGTPLRENMRRQARTPEKGGYMANPNGTAAGLIFDDGKRVVAALPGPPGELQPMATNQLIPFLSKRFGLRAIGVSVAMRFVGVGESSIDQTIHEHLTLPSDLSIAYQFDQGRVDLTFSVPGNSEEDRKRLKALEAELLKYLKEYMYADDGSTLEECAIGLLEKQGGTLVTAEVGTGGGVAASLNNVDGAARRFTGGYVAPSNAAMAQRLGLEGDLPANEQTSQEAAALENAKRACRHNDSEWSISISELYKEENGDPCVWAAVGSMKKGFKTQRMTLRGRGKSAQDRLVTQVLDLFRRRIIE